MDQREGDNEMQNLAIGYKNKGEYSVISIYQRGIETREVQSIFLKLY